MKKTIVLDFNNNLICKNCGVTAAVSLINLKSAIDLFMSQHNECKHGDDVITLNQIAKKIGISEKNFRNYTTKINMPEPLPFSKEFGQKKIFNRVEINQWLEKNDVWKTIREIRAHAKKRNKPYVPRAIKKQVQQQKIEKPLSLMSRFIRGDFDPKEKRLKRQAWIEQARASKPKTLILKCEIDHEWRLTRRFE